MKTPDRHGHPGENWSRREALAALAGAWLAGAAATRAAEKPLPPSPPRARGGDKIFAVNDDGFSAFHTGRYRTAEDLRQAMLAFRATPVAVMEWCVVAGSRTNYRSDVTELIGAGMTEYPRRGDKLAAETFRRLADEGTHTLQVVASACREAGLACYASLRMNGDYPETMWGGSFPRYANSDFWWRHPELRQRDAKGKTLAKQSFAFPETREFRLAILREAARQEIDGINLDFQRHPEFFGFEAPMAEAFRARHGIDAAGVAATDPRWAPLRQEHMSRFVGDVRALLDAAGRARGRRLGLSVRIDWKKYPLWGCDPEAWLQAGWLDYLVVGQYGKGGYDFDLAPFARMTRGSGCALLAGEEAIVDGHDRTAEEDRLIAAGKLVPPKSTLLTAEQYAARSARWYAAGADGVHLFNENRDDILRGLARKG